MKSLKEFDLNMNSWGPYNKEYLGVCHIADAELGATFNVELFPGFFRRKVLASHSSSDNGLKMWGANPDLSHFTYRYELEWKDAVFCDADFFITNDSQCDIICSFTNNTDSPQTVNMNLCASLQYPIIKSAREFASYRIPYEPLLPDGCTFLDAVDYESINADEKLATDGRYTGEFFVDGATGKCTAILGDCFYKKEHFLRYSIKGGIDELLIRYKAQADTELLISVNENTQKISLPKALEFNTVSIYIGNNDETAALELRPTGKPITIDSLVIGSDVKDVKFKRKPLSNEAERKITGNSLTLNYPGIPQNYTIEWNEPVQMLRKYYTNDIGRALTLNIHDHVSEVIRTDASTAIYENILSEPLFLNPKESRTISFRVFSNYKSEKTLPKPLYRVKFNTDGEKYAFSQNMMAYNTFLNVVYPIYTRRQYIRHNTPGRNWDCLYSWDSGFIGMGLATADFERAFDCLYTYLTPVGDPHSPYIFHGSVVPTQIFLYQYLFNKYPDKRDKLRKIYPMIRQFFDFYAKMDEQDGQMKSGLIKTWDIFYNSGGWDDYPPQKHIHDSEKMGILKTKNTTPVITTAITVLAAKILHGLSEQLGIDDSVYYGDVISKYSDAILKYAWNEESGYFSYVVHDSNGNPKEFLKYSDGTDYNMGFDGIYPFIAGICDSEQDRRILENILSGLMTPIGVGTVDTRAPYYRNDGYWNGSVWMPHQWILWRSLFDRGCSELAFKIASTAIELWKKETDESYCCFENFMTSNGRGSGYHQFSGLSTPVLMFFESYYTPGTVTLGFASSVKEANWNSKKSSLAMKCTAYGTAPTALICLAAKDGYSFTLNGKKINPRQITLGAYEIDLPIGESEILIK